MKRAIMTAITGLALTTPAFAKDSTPVFEQAAEVRDQPAVTLKPDKAYVMLRVRGMTQLMLMKMPSAEDQAAYDQLRSKELVKAKSRYKDDLAQWEQQKAQFDRKDPNAFPPGPRPVEPTEGNFEFTSFGLMTAVSIGPLYRFAKSKEGGSIYLEELTPGRYRIYGPLSTTGQAVVGSCFCMGSVSFDAKAGEITDLGLIARDAPPPKPVVGDSSHPLVEVAEESFLHPATADMPIDPRLSDKPVTRAAYRPVGKLPNYFGVTIARMPAMPGVMRYDRDRIIDLTQQTQQ